MRSIYIENLESINEDENLIVSDERARHLIKSVRIKEGESILLLDGMGTVFNGLVTCVQKKSVTINIISKEIKCRINKLDLFISLVKKDAFDDIARMSVELGIVQIFPFESEFSQRYSINFERLARVNESALIQSNNPFLTKIHNPRNFDSFLDEIKKYNHVFLFTTSNSGHIQNINSSQSMALVIGPEGGFSQQEEDAISLLPNVSKIKIDTPIMRAPTALCAAAGYIHGKLTL